MVDGQFINSRDKTGGRMSTFFGLIKEIPGISVDRFDEENLTSSIFFLSHCHFDHMRGLSDLFFGHLNEYKKYLYCSPITKILLENKFKLEGSCIKTICIDTPIVIEYETQSKDRILISVTCISAGHCPGSVMFLFERNDISVLYTGDFRINPVDFPKLKSLHYYENSRLFRRTFTKIYLDTTFLSNDFPFLPSRKESITRIYNVSIEWLNKDPRNVVVLKCAATYGYEFLFMELSKILGLKIHVKSYVYDNYCHIKELSDCVTNDPYSTRIHACKSKISSEGLCCRTDIDNTNIVTIIPSVMKWRKKDTSVVGEWDKGRERMYNVCYSTHSSFDELKAFVQYFDTLEIYPCVVSPEKEDEVYSLLNEITKKSDERVVEINEKYILKLPKSKMLQKTIFKSEHFSSEDDDDS